jgi:hypothetical protein
MEMRMNHNDNQPKGKQGTQDQPIISIGLIAGICVILAVIALFIFFIITSGPGASTTIAPQTCGQTVTSYLNANLVQEGTSALLVAVAEKNGVYQITTRYQGRDIQLYATKDCALLFTNTIPIAGAGGCATQGGTCAGTQPSQIPTPADPVKSSRPAVDLYVMSFCPYGVQAETAMLPVADLLGKKADIAVRYIATIQGSSIDTVQSLHGKSEAKEDARQLCMARHFPDKFLRYLSVFNEQCYPISSDAARLESCQKNVTAVLGIPDATVEQCAAGSEGILLLKADETRSTANRVSGSPTLLINGQVYSGSRTPEAYKQAICAHFDVAPPECSMTLSSQSAVSASGGCG